MPNPFVGCIPCPICVPIEIVVLISGPKQSGLKYGKSDLSTISNNMLLDDSERILAHQLPFYPWSAIGSLATDSECM